MKSVTYRDLGWSTCLMLLLAGSVSVSAQEDPDASPDVKVQVVLDPTSLPKDADKRRKAIDAARESIEKQFGGLVNKFRNEPKLTPEEYAVLDNLFSLYRESQWVQSDGRFAIDVAAGKCALPIIGSESSFKFFETRLRHWQEARPKSPAVPSLLARMYVQWAWVSRGTGFANTVTEDQFEKFHDRMREARFYCEEAEKLVDNDPTIYYHRVKIAQALGEPKTEISKLLRKSHKAGSYYFTTHEGAAEYLLPRWHGEPGDCEKLAAWSKKELGGEEGAEAYARIALMVNNYDRDTVFTGQYDRASLVEGGHVLLKRYPHNARLRSFAALLSYVAKDIELAQAARATFSGAPDASIMPYERMSEMVHQWLTSPHPVAIPSADQQAWLSTCAVSASFSPSKEPILFFTRDQTVLSIYDLTENHSRDLLRNPFSESVTRRFVVSDNANCVVAMQEGTSMEKETTEAGAAVVYFLVDDKEPVTLESETESAMLTPTLLGDGTYFIAASREDGVRVWETSTGKVKHQFKEFAFKASGFAAVRGSRDGRTFAVISSRRPNDGGESTKLSVIEADSGKLLHQLHTSTIAKTYGLPSVSFCSYDGEQWITVSAYHEQKRSTLHQIHLGDRKVRDLCEVKNGAPSVTYASDLSVVAIEHIGSTPEDRGIRLVDTGAAHEFAMIQLPHGRLGRWGFLEENRKFFINENNLLLVWDVAKLRETAKGKE